ncbi:MAG: RagB/SusD family nutrient uptake outer membrane protein [Bacteroidales bacterium]|nr:RagB/SusD family nutrient uptake outer membrane protein [Bacteroidales bacterium]
MKRIYIILAAALSVCACSKFLDTRTDVFDTMDRLQTRSSTLTSFAYAYYTPMGNGFNVIDGNLFASASDEAEQAAPTSEAQTFNRGLLSADLNPLSYKYTNCYEGIRAARFFLEYAKGGEDFLALNRDTSTVYNPDGTVYSTEQPKAYKRDCINLGWQRAEAYIAEAYYYGELLKMYGGVPLLDPETGIARQASYDEVVEHIVDLIDSHLDELNLDWRVALDPTAENAVADVTNWNFRDETGRWDRTSALAVKARVLLYAASPRNNPMDDVEKWEKAAEAANDVIQMRKAVFAKGFGFGEGARTYPDWHMPVNRDYGNYFIKNNATSDTESIFLIRQAAGSAPEAANYPIGTRGGNSGVCPTQNLVDAYEYVGPEVPDPYANRDPRLAATIVCNGSTWNGNVIDESKGGAYDSRVAGASPTGYYLRKFLAPNLNLVEGGSTDHIWPLYRYAEVLLNYAEAMNEAYGPDADPKGYGMTARQALTEVRQSASTSLPAVTATSKTDFRNAVKQERRVELAFEDHRYWDLLRWKDAMTVLNKAIKGASVRKNELGGFQYSYPTVAYRTFYERNYYFPFTRKEISNGGGAITQNPEYN